MMKATKLAIVLVSAGLTVGCASTSDLNALKSRVDALEASSSSTKATADDALSTAQRAESSAKAAESLARKTAADVDAKLNAGFKHKMLK